MGNQRKKKNRMKQDEGRRERITSISVLVEFSGLTEDAICELLRYAQGIRERDGQSVRDDK